MPSPIQFGAEPFTAATARPDGIPDHAAMIEGRLIHLDTKTLKGWGITKAAAKQVIDGIPGVPIRACNSNDPHACDLSFDDDSRVGYATKAWIDGEWVMAAAAVTDTNAAKNIDDGTWTPFGKGGWSVVGYPDEASHDAFKKSGFMDGFQPAGISLVLASTAIPAYVGSGFEMVAAAITNHGDDNMAEENKGGGEPRTYTQAELDKKVEEMLAKQKTDNADALKKAADAGIAKQKEASITELAKQKAELEEKFGKLSDDDKATYEAKIAEMTSKDDMKATLEAHGKEVEARVHDTIKRNGLMTEYKDVMQKSPVAGAPFMQNEQFSQELFDQRVAGFEGLQTAAIAGIVDDAKRVAAAVPGSAVADTMRYSATPPGTETTEADELALCDRMG